MSKLNVDRIAQLVGYRKLNEAGDYDFGGVEPRTQKVTPVMEPEVDVSIEAPTQVTVEADPQFAGMDDDYLRTMLDMLRSAPVMGTSEANLQWMAAASAELARRESFAIAASQAQQEFDGIAAAQAIVSPEADQVSAPVCDVCIDRMGRPERMTVVKDGRFFVHARNDETGELEVFPRDEWDQIVLDNDSMYDNVRVGDRLPQADSITDDDDMVILGIGEDEDVDDNVDMDEGVELDMPGHNDRDDEDDEDDEEDEDLDEGVMDTIRQHVNPETMSKAHSVLLKAGISDEAIKNRDVNMTKAGWTKLAHILSGEAMADVDAEDYCKHVLHALADKLDSGKSIDESEQLDEFVGMGGDQRFTFTTDTLGNVNVTDSMTGASLYLQGQDAQELLGHIEMYGASPEAIQEILAQYAHAMDNQVDQDGDEIGLGF